MRVQFVSNLFPDTAQPQRGLDNATLLHELARFCDIAVLCPRPVLRPRAHTPRAADVGLHPVFLNVPYVPKLGGLFNHRLMARALRTQLDPPRFDVALVSWLFPDGCAAAHLAARGRFPLVLIAQGTDVHHYLHSPPRRRAIVHAVDVARAVITRSADLRRRLIAAGCDGAKIHPVYNGVDTDQFRPGDRAAARHALQLPADAKVVLFAGNFYAVKNPLLLLAAHRRLGPGTVVVMAGAGPLENRLRTAAGAGVRFVGRQTPAGIARLMQAADVLCVPSWNEGVPNVVLEAFASGLPVVATDVGGLREVLDRPVLGSLVPPGDPEALAAALAQWTQASPDTAAIRAHGASFTWAVTAQRYLQILAQAVA